MRTRGLLTCTIAGLLWLGIAGCENTQGTSANPDLTKESVNYKGNDDPQNTGAGAGNIGKPPAGPSSSVGGESASQALVKGTAPSPEAAPVTPEKK